jgi:hypothetical protein
MSPTLAGFWSHIDVPHRVFHPDAQSSRSAVSENHWADDCPASGGGLSRRIAIHVDIHDKIARGDIRGIVLGREAGNKGSERPHRRGTRQVRRRIPVELGDPVRKGLRRAVDRRKRLGRGGWKGLAINCN